MANVSDWNIVIYEMRIFNWDSTKFLFLFPRLLANDRIDFFFLGDFNEVEIKMY